MRVLQLISSTGFYGAEGMLLLLSSRLRESGCDTSIGVFNGSSKQCERLVLAAHKQGTPLWDLPCSGRWDLSTIRHLVKFLRRERIDILHTHGYKANIYGIVAARLAGCSIVATCHNWTDRTSVLRRYGSLDRKLLKYFDWVVAVSEGVASHLVQAGVSRRRLRFITNGIDTRKYQAAKQAGSTSAYLVIGCVARLSKEKGVDVLIRALPQIISAYPELQCVIAGEGPERQQLETLALELGVNNSLHMPGFCEDTPRFLAGCTVVVQPSRIEAMPLAVLEAMASGNAIVASAVGEIPRLLDHGNAGVLVPPGSPRELAKQVVRLLGDPQRMREIEQNAERYVLENCDASVMAANYLEVYAEAKFRKSATYQPHRAVQTGMRS